MKHGQTATKRRNLLKYASAGGLASMIPAVFNGTANARNAIPTGSGELTILSDGSLALPVDLVIPDSINADELAKFREKHKLTGETLTPDCNLTLWRNEKQLVLFDVGAGPNFMPTAGKLVDSAAEAGVALEDVTDVVFTHAHPDHLWGVLDDFDELICPNASYHMSSAEWDYWNANDTLDKTPDVRKSFVAGAQNRFVFLEDKIELFNAGAEILPGIEAVDTKGHTPGHCSFAIHAGNESIMLLGDAITNVALSFEKPGWPSGSDQDQEMGRKTRLGLLDRLAHDKSRIIGFHLPHPGVGFVERVDDHFRFVAV